MSGASATVMVHGVGGRLGRLIRSELAGHPTLTYAGPVLRDGPVLACDVVIDVTSAEGLAALLERMEGQALVVGTTGALPLDALAAYAEQAPVALCPNFSAGVPLLTELVRTAVGALPPGWDIEVVEAHHNQKRDAPSGTAKKLIGAVAEARGGAAEDVPWHSLRVGDTVGEHTVWLCGPGERLELKHVATRREVFAIGALRTAQWLIGQPAGLYRR